MPILNAQIDNIGQSGVVPTFVYLQTNDDVATVTTAGYLNGLVAEGLPISESQVAVIITKVTPNARDVQTNLYSILHAGGNWSLIPLGGAGGGSFYTIQGNSDLNGTSFLGSTNPEPLNIGTGGIVVLRIDDAQDVIWANVPIYEIHASTSFLVASPLINLNSTGGSLRLQGLAAGSSADILYYDSTTGFVTFAAPPGGATAWLVGGNSGLSDPSILGTLTGAGINIQTDGVNAITISSAQVITMPALTVAPGGQKILMVDPTTFQLYISP